MALCRGGLRHAAIRPAARRAAAPTHHHHAAADPADQAPDRRSAHGGDARRHASQRRASVAGLSRRGAGALCRHAARPPGDRRRDHRGPARRAVDARDDRGGARRAGAAAPRIVDRHRSAGSSRPGADACGIVAAGCAEDGTHLRAGGRDASQGLRPPAGRRRRSRSTGGSRPTRWWRRSTRAATWWARCCAGRCRRAAKMRARDARQISARRAGGRALCAGPRQARRAAEAGTGGPDVRFRSRRAVVAAPRPTGSTRWSGR